MAVAKTAGSGPLYEVRRDIDIGPRTLKRGQTIRESELRALAPEKVGPLRRTGIIRPIGSTDREEIAWRTGQHKERRVAANKAGLEQLQGGSDES